MRYDLELDRAVDEIKKANAKTVCIQLPDGLKPQANKVSDYLEEKTGANILIYAGSCFGACDVPNVKADLIIQWGHSEFKK